ncbi:MAG: tetratricopeptide repeat protein, partial [Magnetococcales bacterium]|nr:tetratricopeptide repeat protein [Magnetococcales bacterium]
MFSIPDPSDPALNQALQQAIAWHQAGRLPEAETLYRDLLRSRPDHPDAHHNLGILYVQTGRAMESLPHFQLALDANPRQEPYWISPIEALIQCGEKDAARNLLAQAMAYGWQGPVLEGLAGRLYLEPVDALINMGVLLRGQQRFVEAEAAYRQALEIKPDHADGWFNLGSLLHARQRGVEAEVAYRRVLRIRPDDHDAYNNLGSLLHWQGRSIEAEAAFHQALEVKPDFVGAAFNLALLFREQGRLSEAEAVYREVARRQPDHHEAHHKLANLLREARRTGEALAAYQEALRIRPDFIDAHINLGVLLRELNQYQEAEAVCRRALALRPEHRDVNGNLAIILQEQSRTEEAAACYRQLLTHHPDAVGAALQQALLLPRIPASTAEIDVWRDRYRSGLARLDATFSRIDDLCDLEVGYFFLAYHDRCDRELVEALSRFCRAKSPPLTFEAPHLAAWSPPVARGRRIRVGFLSQFLVDHTIGRLNQGVIRLLDRARFEVVLLHAPLARQDPFRAELDSLADAVFTLPQSLAAQQRMVAEARLDVLYYPDIGMSQAVYYLAFARLAPVQAMGWGHPDTTGTGTIDYFLSSDLIEPEGGEGHYTEGLIRFHRLPSFYPMPRTPRLARGDFGLPEGVRLYGCPQSLFKFHPDFDAVLAEIAAGDPAGRIVVLEGAVSSWHSRLRARWAERHPLLSERVIFLPRMSRERYLGLMANMDLLLDPLHFGSGNTFYEAMSVGTPVITWPGRFMRGRIVAGAYRQMGLEDAPVAGSVEAYAGLALAFAG